jgi:hypothetical protein
MIYTSERLKALIILSILLLGLSFVGNVSIATAAITETKVTAGDGAAGDFFGFSAAISGDTAIVGAKDHSHAGVITGAAYILERDQGGAGNWGETIKLTASNTRTSLRFGWAVSVSGDVAIVGAHGSTTDGTDTGEAYIFERDQGGVGNWGEVVNLTASDAALDDHFGTAVAVSGDTAIVGAKDNADAGSSSGSAYIFDRNQGGAGS